jgi:hypothetical protein
MATVVRAEISEKNKYWIEKHRHYELKHFCLQYPMWRKEYARHMEMSIPSSIAERIPYGNTPSDPVSKHVEIRDYYYRKIKLVENVAIQADPELCRYILLGVTEGFSYTYLKTRMNIPCCKDTYYDRFRKFFWLLDRIKD